MGRTTAVTLASLALRPLRKVCSMRAFSAHRTDVGLAPTGSLPDSTIHLCTSAPNTCCLFFNYFCAHAPPPESSHDVRVDGVHRPPRHASAEHEHCDPLVLGALDPA